VAIGWLIVEDLVTILVLVMLPVIASTGSAVDHVGDVALALIKAGALTGVMLIIGARVLPWMLERVEQDGSRELFTLAVVAVALGIAYAAASVFDVSLALGAFLAGAVLSESPIGRKSGEQVVGLTDVFTVLFFVSVGMLLDPTVLRDHPVQIVVVLAIVVVGKSAAALGLVLLFRRSAATGLVVAAGLAQIGEFSFLLATTATALGLLPEKGVPSDRRRLAALDHGSTPRCSRGRLAGRIGPSWSRVDRHTAAPHGRPDPPMIDELEGRPRSSPGVGTPPVSAWRPPRHWCERVHPSRSRRRASASTSAPESWATLGGSSPTSPTGTR
jgi:Kef-type K+ transport system membrane component KefB